MTKKTPLTPVVALQKHEAQAQKFVEVLEGYEIQTPEEFEEAGEFSKMVAGALKDVKADYDELVKPFKEQIQQIDLVAKPILKRLQDTQARTKALIGDYVTRARQEQLRLAEAAKAALVTDTGEASAPALMRQVREAAPPVVKGIATVTKWKVRVIDPSLVPEQYLVTVVDEQALQRAVDGGARAIAGCEVYEEVSVRTTSGR